MLALRNSTISMKEENIRQRIKQGVKGLYDDKLPMHLRHLRLRMNVKMRDYYRILPNPIGTGAYGEVRMAIYKDSGVHDKASFYKEYRAVKILDKRHMKRENIEAFENEIRMNQILADHPTVLKVHHYFEDRARYMLVMELCNGGELYHDIVKREKFDDNRAAFVTKQLLSVLNDMHDLQGEDPTIGMIHRDLKPENVMLVDADSLLPDVKLIDFGTATTYTKGRSDKKKQVGTMGYMAPELVLVKETKGYNELVDMWALGAIVYFMLTGEMPFIVKDNDRKANEERCRDFIRDGVDDDIFKRSCFTSIKSDAAKDFVMQCLQYNQTPGEPVRMSAKEGLDHQWIQDMTETYIKELVDAEVETKQSVRMEQIAVGAIDALINQYERLDLSQDDMILREACLSIIGHLLLDSQHKLVLQKVFQIMDTSGDGALGAAELTRGYEKIKKGTLQSEIGDDNMEAYLEKVVSNIDQRGLGHINFDQFLIATIDLQADNFKVYCERAYEKFFAGSDTMAVEKMEFFEALCAAAIMRRQTMEAFFEKIDEDKSNTITYEEIVRFFIKACDIDLEYQDVADHMNKKFVGSFDF